MRAALCAPILFSILLATPGVSHGHSQAPEKQETLLVLNKKDETLRLINMASGSTLAELTLGPNPNEVIVSPDKKWAAVSNMGSGQAKPGKTISMVNLATRKVEKTIDLDPHGAPHGIVWLSPTRLLFTSHVSNNVCELDVERGVIVRAIDTQQKGTHLVVLNPDKSKAFAVNAFSGSVTAIDLKTGQVIKQIPTGERAEGISISPDGKWVACGNVAANTVSIIDAEKLEVVKTLENVLVPIRTLYSPDGKHLIVSSVGTGTLPVFSVDDWKQKFDVKLDTIEAGHSAESAKPVPMNFWQLQTGNFLVVLVASNRVAEVSPRTWKVVRSFVTGNLPDGISALEIG